MPDAKPDDLSSLLRIHVEGEDRLPKVVHMHPLTQSLLQIKKYIAMKSYL